MASALRSRLLLIGGIAAACVIVGAGLAFFLPPTYETQSVLLVDTRWEGATNPDAALIASQTLAQTYAADATSRSLLAKVISDAGLPTTPEALAKRITASQVRLTPMVAIKVQAASGDEAASLANAVAQAVVQRNRDAVGAQFQGSAQYLDQELATLDAAIQRVLKESVPANNPQALSDHAARLSVLQTQYTAIFNQKQDAALAQARGVAAVSVAELASAPTRPVSPDPIRYLLAALVIGLFAGVLAALLIERSDDRLHSAAALAAATDTATVITVNQGRVRGRQPGMASIYGPALASLQAGNPSLRLVMLTAASPRDRPKGPAADLAAAAAAAGRRVVVIQSDGAPGDGGVISPNGSVVPTISLAESPDAWARLRAVADGGGEYDFAVVAVPSPEASPLALSMAGTAHVAMIVATTHVTHFADARRTAEALRRAGFELPASILVGKTRSATPKAPRRRT